MLTFDLLITFLIYFIALESEYLALTNQISIYWSFLASFIMFLCLIHILTMCKDAIEY